MVIFRDIYPVTETCIVISLSIKVTTNEVTTMHSYPRHSLSHSHSHFHGDSHGHCHNHDRGQIFDYEYEVSRRIKIFVKSLGMHFPSHNNPIVQRIDDYASLNIYLITEAYKSDSIYIMQFNYYTLVYRWYIYKAQCFNPLLDLDI